MAKWNVELSCGIGFTVTGVEAETRDQGILNMISAYMHRKMVNDNGIKTL